MDYREGPPFDVFEDGIDASAVNVNGACCITIPTSLIPFITGALEPLRYPGAWYGSDTQIIYAMKVFSTLIAELGMMISACGQVTSDCNQSECGGCNDMTANNCVPVKIDNGTLYYKSGCEWVPVGNFSGVDGGHDQIPDITPTDPQEQTDLQCLKANIIANYIYRVVDAFLMTMEDTGPLQYIETMERRAGSQLDSGPLMAMWFAWWANEVLIDSWMDVNYGDNTKQEFICRLAPQMVATTSDLSESEYNAIHAYMAITLGTDVLSDPIFQNAILAINKGRFERAIRLATSLGDTYDCACPDNEVIPITTEWVKIFDFTKGTYGFTKNGAMNQVFYEAGVGWYQSAADGGCYNVPRVGRVPGIDAADPALFRYIAVYITDWPSGAPGGGLPCFAFKNNGAVYYANNQGMRGLPKVSGSGDLEVRIADRIEFGWDEYFCAAQEGGHKCIVSRVVIAGDGPNTWGGLQPDGTWVNP